MSIFKIYLWETFSHKMYLYLLYHVIFKTQSSDWPKVRSLSKPTNRTNVTTVWSQRKFYNLRHRKHKILVCFYLFNDKCCLFYSHCLITWSRSLILDYRLDCFNCNVFETYLWSVCCHRFVRNTGITWFDFCKVIFILWLNV